MTEWLYEAGIGENRAALVADGAILQAEIERPNTGPRAGAVLRARYDAPLVGRRAAQIRLDGGGEAFLDPVPRGLGPGSRFTVEIVREVIFVRAAFGRGFKLPKARIVPDDTPLTDGPDLLERLAASGLAVRRPRPPGPDLLEEAGWSELIEEAATGTVAFSGGRLLIERTEGMTVVDVDGELEPDALAVAGARAAGRAIRRLGIGGSIGVDLPTPGDRAARQRAAEGLDAALVPPFERTAVNGWGFVQIVRPRVRPSLMELIGGDPHIAAAMALYRRAEREPEIGPVIITANHDVVTAFGRHAGNDAELERRRGAPVEWRTRKSLPIWGGHLHVLRQPGPDGLDFDEDD